MGNCDSHEEMSPTVLPLFEGDLWMKQGGVFGHGASWDRYSFVLKRHTLRHFGGEQEERSLRMDGDSSVYAEETQGGAPTKHRSLLNHRVRSHGHYVRRHGMK